MMFSAKQLSTLYLMIAVGGISTSLANPIAPASSASSQTEEITTNTNTTAAAPKIDAAATDYYNCRASRQSYSADRVLLNVRSFPASTASGASGFPHWYNNNEGFLWDQPSGLCRDDNTLLTMPVFPDGHLYNWNSANPREWPGSGRAIYVMLSSGRAALCGVISHIGDSGYFEKCYIS